MSIIDESLASRLAQEDDGQELADVWQLVQTTAPEAESEAESSVLTDRAWSELSARLKSEADVIPLRPAARRTIPAWAMRAAAVLLVSVGGTSAWYSMPVTHEAPRGAQSVVSLPDGSTATLNAGSEIRFRRSFSALPGLPARVRGVQLTGEAFFDVETDTRPFEVSAGSAVVRVLGTRFDVRAREGDEGSVWVAVEEGSVGVRPSNVPVGDATEAILEAGQAVRVAGGSVPSDIGSVSLDRVASWRSGGLAIVDESLEHIVRELAIRLDVDISVAAGVDADGRMSVYYSQLDSLESILSDLATQQGLRYRPTSIGWEIF